MNYEDNHWNVMSFIFPNSQDEWPQLDSSDVLLSLPAAAGGVRHRLLHQLHRDLLPRLPRHPLRHYGGRHLHLHLRHPPPHPGRHSAREESGGKSWLSLQVELFYKDYTFNYLTIVHFILVLSLLQAACWLNWNCSFQDKRCSETDSREEMVHGALGDYPGGRNPSIRLHFYWDVLHFHLILGLQNILRLRLHAARWEKIFKIYLMQTSAKLCKGIISFKFFKNT